MTLSKSFNFSKCQSLLCKVSPLTFLFFLSLRTAVALGLRGHAKDLLHSLLEISVLQIYSHCVLRHPPGSASLEKTRTDQNCLQHTLRKKNFPSFQMTYLHPNHSAFIRRKISIGQNTLPYANCSHLISVY